MLHELRGSSVVINDSHSCLFERVQDCRVQLVDAPDSIRKLRRKYGPIVHPEVRENSNRDDRYNGGCCAKPLLQAKEAVPEELRMFFPRADCHPEVLPANTKFNLKTGLKARSESSALFLGNFESARHEEATLSLWWH